MSVTEMQGKSEPGKIIFTRDEICRVYGFDRQTFYWLIERGAPISRMGSRYFVHRDSFDAFILEMTRDGDPTPDEPHRKAGAGRKTKKR